MKELVGLSDEAIILYSRSIRLLTMTMEHNLSEGVRGILTRSTAEFCYVINLQRLKASC